MYSFTGTHIFLLTYNQTTVHTWHDKNNLDMRVVRRVHWQRKVTIGNQGIQPVNTVDSCCYFRILLDQISGVLAQVEFLNC